MADMPSLLERDLSSKTHSKLLPPLYSSPRVSGGTPGLSSSFPDAEEPPAAGPAIDYCDVFGGPPRYAASAFASQHGSLPTLEDVFSRSSSFKTSLPTYELPVFGDDSPGSRTYDLRPASSFSEEHRRSESHDPFASPNLAWGHAIGASQSKPSSRSASRRMSPAHPAAQLERQLTDEMPFGSAGFSRSSGRKPLESPFTASTRDPSISSLPSSPPHASLWSHIKRSTRSTLGDTIRRSSDMEVDDVFGGFPRRSFPQALKNETYRSNSESGVSGTVDRDFPSSVFSADEQGLAAGDFIEISMDRYRKPSTQQIAEADPQKTQMTMNESYFPPHQSVKPSPSRPPAVPAVQLKVKSWKDWASEFPKSQSVSFSSTCDSSIEGTTSPPSVAEREEVENGDAHSSYVKDWVEASSGCLSGQQTHRNSSAQHSRKNSSELLAVNGNKLKSTSTEETVNTEERELQALLIKAWKINEQREREKMIAQQRREAYVKEKELQWKELRRQPYKFSKASRTQQERQLDQESKEPVIQLKEESPFVSKERKVAENPTSEILSSNSQLLAELQEKVVKLAERKARFSSQESSCRVGFTGDVNDEAGAESFVTSNKHSTSSGAFEAGLETTGKENVAAAQEMAEVNVNDMSESSSDQKSSVMQVHVDEPEKDLQSGEQDDISLSETLEDSNVSLDGFQEIEGESSERRALRWERHVRASRRAAKALEEKQQRDAEVQREQEEKQQLATTLDRTIKRWAAGKEGNLRALLSNLQHVLWSDCGWQPIPLTDLIEGADVKKAYRKATLFVHPDKVQQKGATAQQKYIAERVFDVLQEAWKTFNLQELF